MREHFLFFCNKFKQLTSKLDRRNPVVHTAGGLINFAASDLPDLADGLEHVMKQAEPQFLELGQTLQNLYERAENLAQLNIKTVEAIGGGSEAGVLEHTEQLVKTSLGKLRDVRGSIDVSLKKLSAGSDYLGHLETICPIIENTGMTLNVIGLNIAVESSRSAQAAEMFIVFTQEIRQLAARILDISRNISEDSHTTRSRQITARRAIEKNMVDFGRLNKNAESLVQNALTEIQEIMQLSKTAFEKSTTWSQQISKLVGDVVVAIQFHDIARQKIEHIIYSVEDIKNHEKGTDNAVILNHAYNILRLQSVQLEEVINEIQGAADKGHQAFDIMARHIGDLIDDVSMFDSGGEEESRIRVHIRSLHQGFEQLGTLLNKGCSLEKQIKDTATQVFETASHLSNHIDQVRGISLDLHLKALNAIVKSARLQEKGRALEILAQEVSNLSKESDHFVENVVNIIEKLIEISPEYGVCHLEKNTKDTSNASNAHSLIQDGIQRVSHIYNTFQTDAAYTLEQARNLQSQIVKSHHDLDFLEELVENLSAYSKKINDWVLLLKPWAEYKDEHISEQLEQVARRYTMKSERELHNQHIQPSLLLKEPDEKIEFFDDNSPNTKDTSSKIHEEDDLGDNVELF